MPKTILVIEDHEPTAYLLSRLLRLAGYEPAVAGWGDEGLSLARALSAAAVVLDCHLPGGTSKVDVLAALRSDPETAAVPAVVYSADVSTDRRDAAARLGVAAYVEKGLAPPHAALPGVERFDGPP